MEKCYICGAIIGENNSIGIGGGCLHNVVAPALRDWRYHTYGLEFWNKKCEYVIGIFTEVFDKRKFRNQFKKDFTASIIAQWNEKKILSKKQIEICSNMLEQNHVFINEGVQEIKKNWFDKLHPNNTGKNIEFYEERIDYHRNLYLKGVKNK